MPLVDPDLVNSITKTWTSLDTHVGLLITCYLLFFSFLTAATYFYNLSARRMDSYWGMAWPPGRKPKWQHAMILANVVSMKRMSTIEGKNFLFVAEMVLVAMAYSHGNTLQISSLCFLGFPPLMSIRKVDGIRGQQKCGRVSLDLVLRNTL